ncbi:MAG: mono/diheme cytochrome c family protein [Rhodothermales bacterium]|jgi:mono/diheme cytochrome c family protein
MSKLGVLLMAVLVVGCSEPRVTSLSGPEIYTATCATCHGSDGLGVNNAFPPLAGSAWVALPDSLLIRLTLRGLRGPIRVGEQEYNNVMPPNDFLSNEQLAAVLSFVRREFGPTAAAQSPDITSSQVAVERGRFGAGSMWTIEELTGSGSARR